MSRGRNKRVKSEWVRSTEHAVLALESSLMELSVLCQLYDKGHDFSSRTIATVLFRILEDELPMMGVKRRCLLLSLAHEMEKENFLDSYALVKTKLESTSEGGTVRLEPREEMDGFVSKRIALDQWYGEPIFFEGVSSLLQRQKGHPITKAEKLVRISVTRRELLKCARDETGAHFDRSITYDYLQLHHKASQVTYCFVDQDGNYIDTSSHPNLIGREGNYGAATIRSMANEILASFRVERTSEGLVDVHFYDKSNL